mmetsp:Transcript_20953/g.46768  ORF Transcript_20953/g.46768 Transcript_20953/m.46768 type:complete len:294 (-) Transcript_20953:1058-1939(-)
MTCLRRDRAMFAAAEGGRSGIGIGIGTGIGIGGALPPMELDGNSTGIGSRARKRKNVVLGMDDSRNYNSNVTNDHGSATITDISGTSSRSPPVAVLPQQPLQLPAQQQQQQQQQHHLQLQHLQLQKQQPPSSLQQQQNHPNEDVQMADLNGMTDQLLSKSSCIANDASASKMAYGVRESLRESMRTQQREMQLQLQQKEMQLQQMQRQLQMKKQQQQQLQLQQQAASAAALAKMNDDVKKNGTDGVGAGTDSGSSSTEGGSGMDLVGGRYYQHIAPRPTSKAATQSQVVTRAA